jgi:MoaA/NifB/PqqE/SkfB family radical SAM enzyme
MLAWLKKQWDVISAPSLDWVQIGVTTRCEARCLYCPHTLLAPHWTDQDLPLDLFRALLPFLRHTDLVFLQGWGEPLLNEDLFEMIRLCKERGHRVGFTTNGMLLTEETARRLLDLQLDILAVSLAGTTADTHDRIRRGTNFNRIMANLETFQRLKIREGIPLPAVHLAYIMLRSNFREIRRIVPLARDVGAAEIVASHLSLILEDGLRGQALFSHPQHQAEYLEIQEETKNDAARQGIGFAYRSPTLNEASRLCSENVRRACVVTVDGGVTPCVFLDPVLLGTSDLGLPGPPRYRFGDRLLTIEALSFGNLHEESLTRIWKGAAYTDFRARFDPELRPLPPLPRRCATCYKRIEGREAPALDTSTQA